MPAPFKLRFLLVADTHLGIDTPQRPRVKRRRRGEDFFRNFEAVIDRAGQGDIDFVVHGGDIFYRSRVRAGLVHQVFQPIMALADGGVPVFIVPGNHERSAIPFPLLAAHPDIHIFDTPRTFLFTKDAVTIALAGWLMALPIAVCLYETFLLASRFRRIRLSTAGAGRPAPNPSAPQGRRVQFVGWVERSETHAAEHALRGTRFARPTLRVESTRHRAGPR